MRTGKHFNHNQKEGVRSSSSAIKEALSARSWYEDNSPALAPYPICTENLTCDVAIIGGGFTGLSAAYHLAQAGVNVVLLEAAHIGGGASGRNGGQLGTGQRQWVEELEKAYGFEETKRLFDLAQEAKQHILHIAKKENFDCDFQKGHFSAMHRARYEKQYKAHIEIMRRYGYEHLSFVDKTQMESKIGSCYYQGGYYDSGTGHINPLKAVFGLAHSATKAGAKIFERSPVKKLKSLHAKGPTKYELDSGHGKITSTHVLIATNAHHLGLKGPQEKYVMAIPAFIGATQSLKGFAHILPGNQSVDDSRFVVRYFRKTKNNVLLFGGAEFYSCFWVSDIEKIIRKQMGQIYPELRQIDIEYIWGDKVGITTARMPFVRQTMKNVTFCGGFSGHGVMMAPFVGKLYADRILERNEDLRHFEDLKIKAFPGGALFRRSALFLALQGFALLDRL